MREQDRTEIEAATFRRLLEHLDNHKEVQNIDLMNLANFCRNCLSKWYSAEAKDRGHAIDYENAREIVTVFLTRSGKVSISKRPLQSNLKNSIPNLFE